MYVCVNVLIYEISIIRLIDVNIHFEFERQVFQHTVARSVSVKQF